jgi:hypothetical protein
VGHHPARADLNDADPASNESSGHYKRAMGPTCQSSAGMGKASIVFQSSFHATEIKRETLLRATVTVPKRTPPIEPNNIKQGRTRAQLAAA